jgi:hypothetical protein
MYMVEHPISIKVTKEAIFNSRRFWTPEAQDRNPQNYQKNNEENKYMSQQ